MAITVVNLVDINYFVVELSISNRDKSGVVEDIDFLTTKYQKQFLNDVLGADLYNDIFNTAIDKTVEPWKTLMSLIVDTDTKTSPIANIVYYYYHRKNQTQTVGLGEVKAKAENAVTADPAPKMQRAWLEMSRMVRLLHEYARTNFDAAPFPKWCDVWDKYGIISII